MFYKGFCVLRVQRFWKVFWVLRLRMFYIFSLVVCWKRHKTQGLIGVFRFPVLWFTSLKMDARNQEYAKNTRIYKIFALGCDSCSVVFLQLTFVKNIKTQGSTMFFDWPCCLGFSLFYGCSSLSPSSTTEKHTFLWGLLAFTLDLVLVVLRVRRTRFWK